MEHSGLLPPAPRKPLMALLDKLSAAKRFIYIHAPAGYGKSFSARLWLERTKKPFAWVAVTETSGRTQSKFYEQLGIAMLTLGPDNKVIGDIMTNIQSGAAIEIIERIFKAYAIHDAARVNKTKTVLVIDDFHLIINADILKRLPELILTLPESVTVFLLSRAEPPESISGFVVKEYMAVIDAEHLKFTKEEIKAFFDLRNRRLTEQQAGDIMTATGGWAIGITALLLSDSRKYSEKRLSRYFETFIREQIWDKWDEQRRDFLIRVSVADEFTPDFCSAITGRKDSAEVLDTLVRENAFISVTGENVYRLHHLFLDFLRHLLERGNERLRASLYQQAGDWFYNRADYYKAVEYYIKCGSKDGIAKGLKLMYNYNSPYASIEDTAAIIRWSVDDSVVEEYPFLLETLAWAAYAEGRCDDMERYLDKYFRQLPKIILQNPVSAVSAFLFRFVDYRNNITDVLQSADKIPLKRFIGTVNTPSVTQNMPFFHRSSRDYSEMLYDTDKSFSSFKKTFSPLFSEAFVIIEKTLLAGFAYERRSLDAAHEYALSAAAEVEEHIAPELQFCAYMILAAAEDALNNRDDAQKALNNASAMIERHKARYLEANLRAYMYRSKLGNGSADAAREWLKYNAEPSQSHLLFYKMYRYFTTVRAYIVTGEYNNAILFLKRLSELSERYRRPLDIIEANILLAIANWKKASPAAQTKSPGYAAARYGWKKAG